MSDELNLAGSIVSKMTLIGEVLSRMKGSTSFGSPRWDLVREQFGLTLTEAYALCQEFSLDPEEVI